MEHPIDDLDLTELTRSSFKLIDDSLLPKRHCFVIRQKESVTSYYSAHTKDERLLWVTLMKQAAGKVESRGLRYRVDRSIRVRVIEARNLKTSSHSNNANNSNSDRQSWYSVTEVSGERLSRTVAVFGDGSNGGSRGNGQPVAGKQGEPCWMEDFVFNEIGSTGGELMVSVWTRVRKKENKVGCAVIPLVPIKPGIVLEEWFPIYGEEKKKLGHVHSGSQGSQGNSEKEQKGEIRLKIRYDRLSVLPSVEYEGVKKVVYSYNFRN